jgi:hypothetical protein
MWSLGRRDEELIANPYPRPRYYSAPARTLEGMTTFLTALGAGLGIALLVIMALLPALEALPLRRRDRAVRPQPSSAEPPAEPLALSGGPGPRRSA